MRLRSHANRPWCHVIHEFPFLRLPYDARYQVISFISGTELVEWMYKCLATKDMQVLHVFVDLGCLKVLRDDEAGFPLLSYILDAVPGELDISSEQIYYALNLPQMDIDCVSGDRGVTALMVCAYRGHYEWAKRLIMLGANKDITTVKCCDICNFNLGNTALMWAVQQNHLEIVKLLIDSHCDVNKSNHKGWTPLMLAASSGHTAIALYLVLHGALIDGHATEDNWTALSMAVFAGHLEIVEALVNAGCDLEVSSKACCTSIRCHNVGKTPLIMAASQGHTDIVDVLIANGANLNVQTEYYGTSPLIYAARRGYSDMVQSLCSAGADVSLTDWEGCDATHYAQEEGHLDVLQTLVPHLSLVETAAPHWPVSIV